ncbi:MAG: PilZ domain-containing protein [Candidatus Sulfotelmatobacter sp.]
MSDEENAGAAYLAALKKSTPQAAAAAPARAPILPSSNLNNGIGAPANTISPVGEKRKSPRYRCQGSARLREIVSGVSTWATFTDISLHGCYVEAMATFRVGAKLGLTMEVNGFRVECNGEAKVVYPNLGMGIAFTTMSDSDRERLRELLRSLSRPSVILGARQEVKAAPVHGADGLSIPANSATPVTNPDAALRAVMSFFDERHILSREEFFRILRRSQTSGR